MSLPPLPVKVLLPLLPIIRLLPVLPVPLRFVVPVRVRFSMLAKLARLKVILDWIVSVPSLASSVMVSVVVST